MKHQVHHRRWVQKILQRVQAAQRPNNEYIDRREVLDLLQHVSDGINELLMTRPLDPMPWLGDYLRRSCKVHHRFEIDEQSQLVLEMHRKRRIIQNALRDTKTDEVESKQLIREIIHLQQELQLSEDELLLTPVDHVFLVTEPPSVQDNWSIDVAKAPLVITGPNMEEQAAREALQRLTKQITSRQNLDSYYQVVMDGIIKAVVELQLATPDDPVQWMILYLQMTASDQSNSPFPLSLFFTTNYELARKIEQIKLNQCEMHARIERLHATFTQLQRDLALRNQYIEKLSTIHVTTRTQAIMEGTPVFLDSQKHWVLPGYLLKPWSLSSDELLSLRRAEQYLMEQDELRWKFLLTSQKRFEASVTIQSSWRCWFARRSFKLQVQQRKQAAIVIQRNYLHYLYYRAISLPKWCVLGREVVIAPSVAQKCAITFQFYPKKDFPVGNSTRLESGLSIQEMMERCRDDELCAGFTTDGIVKRFLPRKLSQLQDMQSSTIQKPLTMQDGLYVKVFPEKNDQIVNTGVIVAVPADRFAPIDVVLDGIGILEKVPLAKLMDRWKRIRIKRHQGAKKKERPKGTIMFGKAKEELIDDDENDDVVLDVQGRDYEKLEDDDEEAERRRQQQRRRKQHNKPEEDEEEMVEYIYEDQGTGKIVRREPLHTHTDANERAKVLITRKRQYDEDKQRQFEAKKLASVIRLQCAWRSKRARDAFRQVLQLRAKEKERDRLVQEVHVAKGQHTRSQQKKKTNATSFFSKWRRN